MSRRRRNAAKSRAAAKAGKRGRGGRTGSAAQLQELVSRTVSELVAAINRQMRGDMAAEARGFIASKGATAGRIGRPGRPALARKKRLLPCIAPGCSNRSKGPRFQYVFEKHMNAPRKEYEAWRLKAKEARSA